MDVLATAARGRDIASAPRSVVWRRRHVVLAALVSVTLTCGCASPPNAGGVGSTAMGKGSNGNPAVWDDDVFELSAKADRAYRESRWIDAARQYDALTKAVPEDSYAWFRLGNTFARQGAFDRAILAYETSLERDPEQPKPWFNLSTTYLLNAQRAMRRAWGSLRPGDPAKVMIEQRLVALDALMHDRIEDDFSHTGRIR